MNNFEKILENFLTEKRDVLEFWFEDKKTAKKFHDYIKSLHPNYVKGNKSASPTVDAGGRRIGVDFDKIGVFADKANIKSQAMKLGAKIQDSTTGKMITLEKFEDDFLKTLSKMKGNEFDLDDDEANVKAKKKLEALVKILNQKIDKEFTEPEYYKMVGKLFCKSEAKRIMNHFIRKRIITGSYEGSKMKYMVMRKIERPDYRNFY